MGSGRGKSARGRAGPPAQPIAYNVTGTLEPDATCNYIEAGINDGKPYYRRLDSAFFIWWSAGFESWTISKNLCEEGEAFWFRMNPEITGVYGAGGAASGIPTGSH